MDGEMRTLYVLNAPVEHEPSQSREMSDKGKSVCLVAEGPHPLIQKEAHACSSGWGVGWVYEDPTRYKYVRVPLPSRRLATRLRCRYLVDKHRKRCRNCAYLVILKLLESRIQPRTFCFSEVQVLHLVAACSVEFDHVSKYSGICVPKNFCIHNDFFSQ